MSVAMPDKVSADICARLPPRLLSLIDQLAMASHRSILAHDAQIQYNLPANIPRSSLRASPQPPNPQASSPGVFIDLTDDDEPGVEGQLRLDTVDQRSTEAAKASEVYARNEPILQSPAHPPTPHYLTNNTSPSTASPGDMASPMTPTQYYRLPEVVSANAKASQGHGIEANQQHQHYQQSINMPAQRPARPQSRTMATHSHQHAQFSNIASTPNIQRTSLSPMFANVRQLAEEQAQWYSNYLRMQAFYQSGQYMPNQPYNQLVEVSTPMDPGSKAQMRHQRPIQHPPPAPGPNNVIKHHAVIPPVKNVQKQHLGTNDTMRASSLTRANQAQAMADINREIEQRRAEKAREQGGLRASATSGASQHRARFTYTIPEQAHIQRATPIPAPTLTKKRSICAVDSPALSTSPTKAAKVLPAASISTISNRTWGQTNPTQPTQPTQRPQPPLPPHIPRPAPPCHIIRSSPDRHANNPAMARIEKWCRASRIAGLKGGEQWAYTMGNIRAEKPHYHFGEDIRTCTGCGQLGIRNVHVLQKIHDRYQGDGGL